MLKNHLPFTLGNFVLSILIIILISACALNNDPLIRAQQQEQVAKALNAKPEDYKNLGEFPFGYFYKHLQKGMTIKDVHGLVREYESVFNCTHPTSYDKEIYYYYSNNDDVALRFVVFYDDENKFVSLLSEDTNSRSISIKGCTEGRLKD